jgi:hypothetical protein
MNPKEIRSKLTMGMITKKQKTKNRAKHLHFGLEYKESRLGALADKMMPKDGNCRRSYKSLSNEMAALILTRWAKRALKNRKFTSF